LGFGLWQPAITQSEEISDAAESGKVFIIIAEIVSFMPAFIFDVD
jgi:hypothetical protein